MPRLAARAFSKVAQWCRQRRSPANIYKTGTVNPKWHSQTTYWTAAMTRSRRSARQAGSRTERALADYLALELGDDRIDRRVKYGTKDRGDISGLRVHGQRVVIEVKDCTRPSLPEWVAEAHTEAGNDDALVGIVAYKRRATTDPGRWWVAMTVDDLLALLDGQRHGHRKDTIE